MVFCFFGAPVVRVMRVDTTRCRRRAFCGNLSRIRGTLGKTPVANSIVHKLGGLAMKFLSIFAVLVFSGVAVTAQNIDMSSMTPLLTYPDPKPTPMPETVSKGKTVIGK